MWFIVLVSSEFVWNLFAISFEHANWHCALWFTSHFFDTAPKICRYTRSSHTFSRQEICVDAQEPGSVLGEYNFFTFFLHIQRVSVLLRPNKCINWSACSITGAWLRVPPAWNRNWLFTQCVEQLIKSDPKKKSAPATSLFRQQSLPSIQPYPVHKSTYIKFRERAWATCSAIFQLCG